MRESREMATVENALNIYTDGSSLGRPRAGGVGIRFIIVTPLGEEQIRDLTVAGYRGATNNQMELNACVIALKEALELVVPPHIIRVVIYSDSQYVVGNYKRAMFEWPKTRWHTRTGKPVLNAMLWKELLKYLQKIRMPVEFRWVKGHSKNEHNRAVDQLARTSAKQPFNRALSHVNVRRKLTPKAVEVGSVEMAGQRITIRIITSEYLHVQRIWKYKYEVISRRSEFHGNVDIIFSNHHVGAGRTYSVRFNSDTDNPRIEKVFREIEARRDSAKDKGAD